jgi:hypothetical protein
VKGPLPFLCNAIRLSSIFDLGPDRFSLSLGLPRVPQGTLPALWRPETGILKRRGTIGMVNHSAARRKGVLDQIAHRAMKEYGFQPDFSAAAFKELETVQRIEDVGDSSEIDLRHLPWAIGLISIDTSPILILQYAQSPNELNPRYSRDRYKARIRICSASKHRAAPC